MNKDTQDLIDGYLLDTLSDEERVAFEKEIRNDEELATEVELARLIIDAIAYKAEKAALDEMKQMTRQEMQELIDRENQIYANGKIATGKLDILSEPEPEQVVTHRNFPKWIIYTSLAVAASIVLFYVGIQNQYPSGQLFNEYYAHQPYEITRGGDLLTPDETEQLSEARTLYEQAKYAEALAKFNTLQQHVSPENMPEEVVYYSAICLIETQQFDLATQQLLTLTLSDKNKFQPDAQWHLALVYLEKDDRSKAIEILKAIEKLGNNYSDSAKVLLDKLAKRKWFQINI